MASHAQAPPQGLGGRVAKVSSGPPGAGSRGWALPETGQRPPRGAGDAGDGDGSEVAAVTTMSYSRHLPGAGWWGSGGAGGLGICLAVQEDAASCRAGSLGPAGKWLCLSGLTVAGTGPEKACAAWQGPWCSGRRFPGEDLRCLMQLSSPQQMTPSQMSPGPSLKS